MKKVVFTLAMIIGLGLNAQAQTSESVTQVKTTDRAGKNWMAVGQLTGLTSKVGTESGAAVGMYLDTDSVLLLEVYGTEGDSFFHDLSSSTKIKSTNIAVMYKKFLGNSFYIKGGAVGRSVDFTRTETPQDEKFQGTSFGGSIGLGNQWHIKNFTLGADWISYTQPFFSNVSSEQYAAPASSSFWHASLEDNENEYLKNAYFQFVRFYVGASF